MKKILLLLFVFTIGFVFAVASEDLGELAKKEKARREALEKQGKQGKTFTNADLANVKSQIAYEKTSAEPEGQTPSGGDQAAAGEDATAPSRAQSGASAELAAQDQKLRELQAQHDQLQQEIDKAKQAVGQGGVFHSANVGSQYQSASEAQQKMEEVDKQIGEVKKQQEETRRRMEEEQQEKQQQSQQNQQQQQPQ